jgi:hypothetical protein
MSSTDKLEQVLGMVEPDYQSDPTFELLPVPIKKNNIAISSDEKVRQNKEDDYNYARETLQHLVGQGNEALQGVLALAVENANPRTFEVIATLIKTVSDVSKDLIDLDDKMTEKKVSTQTAEVINNTQIVASQEDILKALQHK